MPLSISYLRTPLTGEISLGDADQVFGAFDVMGLANGGFAAAYAESLQGRAQERLKLDFYNAVPQHISGPTEAATIQTVPNPSLPPSLVQLENGNVLVAWGSFEPTRLGIRASLFSPTGGPPTEIALGLDNSYQQPQAAALSGGGFVITAEHHEADDSQSFYWFKYDAAGHFQSSARIDTQSAGEPDLGRFPYQAVAGLADGGFVVAFSDTTDFDHNNVDVRAAIFNADGTPRKADFIVAGDHETTPILNPDVAALPNGSFAVVYDRHGLTGEGSTTGIEMAIYTAAGTNPITVHVNTADTLANETNAHLTVLSNGFILVTWNRQSDSADFYGRVFAPDGTPVAIGNSNQFLIKGGVGPGVTAAGTEGSYIIAQHAGADLVAQSFEITRMGVGTDGNDSFNGDDLRDTLFGGGGSDTLNGLGGTDSIFGEADNDTLRGGDGNDLVSGGTGDDQIEGGNGDDDLRGEGGEDTLLGGDGSDTLSGGADTDQLIGGAGNDTYSLGDVHLFDPINGGGALKANVIAPPILKQYVFDNVTEDPNGGTDTVVVQRTTAPDGTVVAAYTLGPNVENGTVIGTGAFALTGNAQSNYLLGSADANTLRGAGGSDTIDGGGGLDRALYAAVRANYFVITQPSLAGLVTYVIDETPATGIGPDGSDSVLNVEQLQFLDRTFTIAGIDLNRVSNFDGHRFDDVMLQVAGTNQLVFANMQAGANAGFGVLTSPIGNLTVVGHADINGDGIADVVVQEPASGIVLVAQQNGSGTPTWVLLTSGLKGGIFDYHAVGLGDINGDGQVDVLLQNEGAAGDGSILAVTGQSGGNPTFVSVAPVLKGGGVDFQVKGVGDINGDGFADVVLQDQGGAAGQVLIRDLHDNTFFTLATNTSGLKVVGVGDVNGDGHADVILQATTGGNTYYLDPTIGVNGFKTVVANIGNSLIAHGVADVDNDGSADVLFQLTTNGEVDYRHVGATDADCFWGAVATPNGNAFHLV